MKPTDQWLCFLVAALLTACQAATPARSRANEGSPETSHSTPPAAAATWTPAPAASPAPPATATTTATAVPTNTPSPEPSATPHSDDVPFLARPGAASLRVMSYNVNWDSLFAEGDEQNHALRSANRVASFRRIMAAIQPDIVCLQEVNPARDPAQISTLLEETLAPQGGHDWTATSTRDSVIASRFPVLAEGLGLVVPAFPRELAQAAALVDLPDEVYGPLDVYLICAHFKAGGNLYDILLRQRQADIIIRQIGDALTPGGNLDLPAGTPLVVLGDFNIYDTDPAAHLDTLLTGDIDHEDQYGPDAPPDWDGTALADAQPSHNGLGVDFYTWRSDPSPLNPGRLDRILYSDSALAVENAFILNTTLLGEAALFSSGLEADDVMLNPATGYYDHLPLVVDFVMVAR